MISKTAIEITTNECITEINTKLKRLHEILMECPKIEKEEDVSADMMTFSPEEWENIAISLKHYSFAIEKLKKCKEEGEESVEEWFYQYTPFLGYLRDMACAWYNRLPPRAKA